MTTAIQLKTNFSPMRPAASSEAAELYRAALDWSLEDPIVIASREDLASEKKWKDLVEPFHHQVTNLLTFCRRLPVTLLADDVGLGKTISAGLVVSELMARRRVNAFLVVCPKILAEQWKEELATKFNINSVIAIGNELVNAELQDERYAVITTYDTARLHLEKIPDDRFQMLILDEAHKLRNLFGVPTPPQRAKVFKRVLEQRMFKYVLMLTATPIQNRLWDLYSMIDLLTVAKGHENPFGSPGQFKRKFILDTETDARVLNPEAKDEFQSIVYNYMSRVRRNDANLSFPDRTILTRSVVPTEGELRLLEFLSKQITHFNVLTQVGILKAFTSSPHAVKSFCRSMARNGTAPQSFADEINELVSQIGQFSKLRGLAQLLTELSAKNPPDWRAVVFTTSRETQTSIETYIAEQGFSFGLINGTTGARNSETLSKFRETPPKIHVIVSTEAGAEGVNLQSANVLINFDLPWNPMIVEQRIGRVQRLGSKHASVAIYNLVLGGTFDDYIVGRLLEKLQMASHAIGDIEALLESTGLGGGEDSGEKIEDLILKLILASLRGQDVEKATREKVASIEKAKEELAEQEQTINSMLGSLDDQGLYGPKAPKLSPIKRTMNARKFVVKGLESLGAQVSVSENGTGTLSHESRLVPIAVDGASEEDTRGKTDYRPGGSSFARLTQRLSKQAIHQVEQAPLLSTEEAVQRARKWARKFSGEFIDSQTIAQARNFEGTATLKVRAFVAHDSFEKIIQIPCEKLRHHAQTNKFQILQNIESAEQVGLNLGELREQVLLDGDIAEFCRFYSERCEIELAAAMGDERKSKRLKDEFTPRIDASVVGLLGRSLLSQKVAVGYQLSDGPRYQSSLVLSADENGILAEPDFADCALTGRSVPVDCLDYCTMSEVRCLSHLLQQSEFSGQKMLPEFAVKCAASGKVAGKNEVEVSDLTGLPVHKSLIATSAMSGTKAEPNYFGTCAFTGTRVLTTELFKSEFGGKYFRKDRALKSVVSGKIGDKSELKECPLTKRLFASGEGEKCAVTGVEVFPDQLQSCEVTSKRVLPSELLICGATGKIAVRDQFVTSSVSSKSVLRSFAIQSISGHFCLPQEREYCSWSNAEWHPEDVIACQRSNCLVHIDYIDSATSSLRDFVNFVSKPIHERQLENYWETISSRFCGQFDSKNCEILAAMLSPGQRTLACKALLKSVFGLRKRKVAFIFSFDHMKVLGSVVEIGQ